MFLLPILTLFLIIWFVFYIFNNSHYNSQNHYNNFNNNPGYSLDRSLEILRERYAKGEISEEEYLKIKRNLEN